MAENWNCLLCGKPIGMWDKVCKYCGEHQFGENDEYYPDENSYRKAQALLASPRNATSVKKEKHPIFTEEEAFLMGIHPQDAFFRKTMELDILGKDYDE